MMPVGAGRVAILLALVIVVCTAVRASAQLYEWVDEKGQHNFTDNPNSIPEKYRPKATVSPSLQATPETLRRDAERRGRDELEFRQRAAQRELANSDYQWSLTAAQCARVSNVEIIHKPGAAATILGTTRQRFNFDKCMAERGKPTKQSD